MDGLLKILIAFFVGMNFRRNRKSDGFEKSVDRVMEKFVRDLRK